MRRLPLRSSYPVIPLLRMDISWALVNQFFFLAKLFLIWVLWQILLSRPFCFCRTKNRSSVTSFVWSLDLTRLTLRPCNGFLGSALLLPWQITLAISKATCLPSHHPVWAFERRNCRLDLLSILLWRGEQCLIPMQSLSPFGITGLLFSLLSVLTVRKFSPSNALKSFSSTVSNCWVDVFTDSQVLLRAWRRQGAKSTPLIASLKRLFVVISYSNIHLSLYHIPSECNVA